MKKGFTLIELLAVIVILAIIALIATPIIINIIEDSRKSAATDSAQLYVDGLAKSIVAKNMTNEFNPSSCTIAANGNVTCDGTSLTYEVNGDKPTSGSITFNNGIVTGYTLCMSDYRITKSGNNVTSEKESNCIVVNNPAYTLGQLLQYDPVNNEGCSTGATCYKWRVITPNDTTSNSTITLQMDHNLVNGVAWVTQTDYDDDENWDYYGNTNKGPITALKALETATSSWDNSLKLNYSYDTSAATYNYGTLSCTNGACTIAGNTITTNLKARMITGEEMRAITVAAGAGEGTLAYNWRIDLEYGDYFFSSEHCPIGTYGSSCTGGVGDTSLAWLVENTTTTQYSDSGSTLNTYDEEIAGYWALTPRSSYPDVWFVEYTGMFTFQNTAIDDEYFGVRPVITIPKSVLN